jgi:hypothetical protein
MGLKMAFGNSDKRKIAALNIDTLKTENYFVGDLFGRQLQEAGIPVKYSDVTPVDIGYIWRDVSHILPDNKVKKPGIYKWNNGTAWVAIPPSGLTMPEWKILVARWISGGAGTQTWSLVGNTLTFGEDKTYEVTVSALVSINTAPYFKNAGSNNTIQTQQTASLFAKFGDLTYINPIYMSDPPVHGFARAMTEPGSAANVNKLRRVSFTFMVSTGTGTTLDTCGTLHASPYATLTPTLGVTGAKKADGIATCNLVATGVGGSMVAVHKKGTTCELLLLRASYDVDVQGGGNPTTFDSWSVTPATDIRISVHEITAA